MSGLSAAMASAAGALEVYDRVFEVTQNNVDNANTPGYAKQTQTLEALPFDLASGALGGVAAGEVVSARDQYAEQAVRSATTALGTANQNVQSLTSVQSVFDITGDSGLPYALNNLFQSFSAWAQSPTGTVERQSVVEQASAVASAFEQTAAQLGQVRQDVETKLQQTVATVNQLTAQLAALNQQVASGGQNDAGLDAQVDSTLETLSQYVDVTASKQPDGATTVLLNGQTPLVLGTTAYQLTYQLAAPQDPPPDYPQGPPSASILSGDNDVTSQIATGSLGALLDVENRVLPSYLGNAYQAGDLNAMAKQFADCVNQIFTSGNIDDGDPPQGGVALFTYDASNDADVAASMAVDPTVTPDQLAAIDPGPPPVDNGIPLQLSALANPQSSDGEIENVSYSEFFGQMAARVGSELSAATDDQQAQQSTVAQAQDLRQQTSGVSLDEEAMTLVQFQRAYEANSHLITILDELTEDAINMLLLT
jgi:flagellar hook-associated protein 1 FlgK